MKPEVGATCAVLWLADDVCYAGAVVDVDGRRVKVHYPVRAASGRAVACGRAWRV